MRPEGPFDAPCPRWFTIGAHRPFLEDLARGVADSLLPLGPDALAQAIVLVPTRRAARALAEAFLKVTGANALLLPQVRALGDLDEGEPPFEPGVLALDLPPAPSAYRRRFELARLVSDHAHLLQRSIDAAGALELGDALGGFLDSVQIEEAQGVGDLDASAEGDLARHWRISASFLRLAVEEWPRRLHALGLIDVNERRVRLLDALTEQWTERPPATPLIAAGSTGAAPATARLLDAVARAPQGLVVLPGLDLDLAQNAWDQVGEQHPQGAMKRLLGRAGVGRDDVHPWPAGEAAGQSRGRWRRRLINEALRPAEATADWRDQIARLREEARGEADPIAEGLQGLILADGRNEEHAAALAALLMRETLETPGKTCALITPDRDLARRTSARLARWGVQVDSSAGTPLSHSSVGVLLGLLAQAAAEPVDPVDLLALIKHPLVRLGLEPQARERGLLALERYGVRGPRPESWDQLRARLTAKTPRPDAEAVLDAARAALEPLQRSGAPEPSPEPAAAHARRLAQAAEALAADAGGDIGALWAGPDGEAAAGLIAALIEDGAGLPPCSAFGFRRLLERLMAGAAVRLTAGVHPRLMILGAIEARLVRADRLILAGLEEGVWPQAAPIDPFLSRPMRAALGLPPPERRVGLSAHDFAQAACAPEVVLLHAERREGAPAVPSRWLWRLKTLALGAGLGLPQRPELAAWAEALDRPDDFAPARRPEPRPPVGVRPRELPVTSVETLTRDPYAVYARRVLNLRRLERPDEPVEARARGTAIHAAFEAFARRWPDDLPADAASQFQSLYLAKLRKAGAPEAALAREQALAREAAAWIETMERERREGRPRILVEQDGVLRFASTGGEFVLTARADRIELTRAGAAHVLDFKTGRAPSAKEVAAGFSPQLSLTAAIIAAGGFKAVGRAEPGDLVYLRVTGRRPAGEQIVRAAAGGESADLAARALEGLTRLIARFDDPGHPYRSRTAPQFVKAYRSDFDHLARVGEWSALEEDEG
ncbi:MAG TPA: double-strand break repair protein AddB [Caulobacteraceae bacterium]|nr:double-strand break repair protein AddB [Caulobacteraceae bacterium]